MEKNETYSSMQSSPLLSGLHGQQQDSMVSGSGQYDDKIESKIKVATQHGPINEYQHALGYQNQAHLSNESQLSSNSYQANSTSLYNRSLSSNNHLVSSEFQLPNNSSFGSTNTAKLHLPFQTNPTNQRVGQYETSPTSFHQTHKTQVQSCSFQQSPNSQIACNYQLSPKSFDDSPSGQLASTTGQYPRIASQVISSSFHANTAHQILPYKQQTSHCDGCFVNNNREKINPQHDNKSFDSVGFIHNRPVDQTQINQFDPNKLASEGQSCSEQPLVSQTDSEFYFDGGTQQQSNRGLRRIESNQQQQQQMLQNEFLPSAQSVNFSVENSTSSPSIFQSNSFIKKEQLQGKSIFIIFIYLFIKHRL